MELQQHSEISASGTVNIAVFDTITGKLVDSKTIPNLIVSVGKQYIASRMVSNSTTVVSHMAIGGGTASPISGNTALGSEISRKALSSLTNTTNQIVAVATFGNDSSGSISEAGIFNASSSGTMLCRTAFTPFTKTTGETVIVTWTITIA